MQLTACLKRKIKKSKQCSVTVGSSLTQILITNNPGNVMLPGLFVIGLPSIDMPLLTKLNCVIKQFTIDILKHFTTKCTKISTKYTMKTAFGEGTQSFVSY